MNKMAVHEAMGRTALDQLASEPTSRAPNVVNEPRRLRAVGAIILTTPRQFPANRARRPGSLSRTEIPVTGFVHIGARFEILVDKRLISRHFLN